MNELKNRLKQEFDKDEIQEKLRLLPVRLRAAFAASIAERLFPYYVNWAKQAGRGQPLELRSALDRLWEYSIESKEFPQNEIDEIYRKALQTDYFMPHEDVFYSGLNQSYAEHAVGGALYALKGLSDLTMVVNCAEQEGELIDLYITNHFQIPFEEKNAVRYEKRAELVKKYMARQKEDLADLVELRKQGVENIKEKLIQIKSRSKETFVDLSKS